MLAMSRLGAHIVPASVPLILPWSPSFVASQEDRIIGWVVILLSSRRLPPPLASTNLFPLSDVAYLDV